LVERFRIRLSNPHWHFARRTRLRGLRAAGREDSTAPARLPSLPQLQSLQIPRNRCHREGAATPLVGKSAVSRLEVSFDFDRIPILRVADVVDGDIIVLTPEERHRVERLAVAQDISGRNLTLTLCHNPMLDADALPEYGSGHRAMSPAAKTRGALVFRYSLTAMPRSIARPACSANAREGCTPTPRTTKSASSSAPPVSINLRPLMLVTVLPR